jgi:signal transduction histidine kinase
MLAEDRATPSTVLLWGLARDAGRGMSGRPIAARRAERKSRVLELAPTLTRDVVRRVAAGAIGVNIALSLIDVWRVAYYPSPRPPVGAAALAALVTIPLHIRHVLYGLRGERPPAGIWTLAALAIVNAIATAVVGSAWIFQYASLAVSILIVVPGVLGTALAVAVLVSPLLLVGTQWYGGGLVYPGFYLTFAMTWRAATQFVPLRLLAAIRALDTAGRELEARAVVQTRVRIDGELRTGVAGALQQIVARGEVARAAAERDPAHATVELRELVGDSRRALTQARRVVAGYRRASVRAELDAATALLEASGAQGRIDAAPGVSLDLPDDEVRRAIRLALAQALRDEPNAGS